MHFYFVVHTISNLMPLPTSVGIPVHFYTPPPQAEYSTGRIQAPSAEALGGNNFRNVAETAPLFQIESRDKTRIFRDLHAETMQHGTLTLVIGNEYNDYLNSDVSCLHSTMNV